MRLTLLIVAGNLAHNLNANLEMLGHLPLEIWILLLSFGFKLHALPQIYAQIYLVSNLELYK